MTRYRAFLTSVVVTGGIAASLFAGGVSGADEPVVAPATDVAQPAHPPQSPLMRGLFDLIAENFGDEPFREGLLQDLREADAVYSRIKRENAKGIWLANHPPRLAPH